MTRRPYSEWHRLSSVSVTDKEAVCSKCGRIRIIIHSPGYYVCVNSKEETRYKNQIRPHGLTPEEASNYIAMTGCCEVCATEKNLVVDHDHVTGKLRGVLCRRCNVILAYIETPTLRGPFEEYLESYGGHNESSDTRLPMDRLMDLG